MLNDEQRRDAARNIRDAVALARTVHHEDRAGFVHLVATIENPIGATMQLIGFLLGFIDHIDGMTRDQAFDRWLAQADEYEAGKL